MNNADIVGLVCIALGLLLVILALYASPIFVIISGVIVAGGIVLIITGGNMCRGKQDREPDERPLYAEAVPKVVEVVESPTGRAQEPPLTRVAL